MIANMCSARKDRPWLGTLTLAITTISHATYPLQAQGPPLSAFEYAKMIEPELGVPPIVDCGAGVEIPIYVDGKRVQGDPGIHCCDNPSLQMGDCMSGSSLQRYEGKTRDGKPLPNVVWVSFARHDGRDNVFETDVGDSVQMIGHNTETGATAFFESGDNREWVRVEPKTNRLIGVLPGIDDPDGFNRAYVTPQSMREQCVRCHQSDPFIHNPFIDAARLPSDPTQPVVPEVAGPDSPYYVIGAPDWDMRTIHIEGNACLDCHRIGMKTVEEFVGDGWDPNAHMPPHDPGSLRADFQELLEAWIEGPENAPGCDWIIPPAGETPSQIVGEDYPHQAGFNTPDEPALSRLNKKPVPIPEPAAEAASEVKQTDRMNALWRALAQSTADRFRKEIARRSPDENRRELEALHKVLRSERQRGNQSRVKMLSLEIEMIEETLAANLISPDNDAQGRSPELEVLERFAGAWEGESTTSSPAGFVISKQRNVAARRWTRGGQFLLFEEGGTPETTMLLTHDRQTGTYPGVMMQGSSRNHITGTWDASTQTMSFYAALEDGNELSTTHRFVKRNVAEGEGVVTDQDGRVIVRIAYTQRRSDADDEAAERKAGTGEPQTTSDLEVERIIDQHGEGLFGVEVLGRQSIFDAAAFDFRRWVERIRKEIGERSPTRNDLSSLG